MITAINKAKANIRIQTLDDITGKLYQALNAMKRDNRGITQDALYEVEKAISALQDAQYHLSMNAELARHVQKTL